MIDCQASRSASVNYAVILFDGVCNLCRASVRFVIDRDSKTRFRFAFLQSDGGRRLLEEYGLSASELTAVILITEGRAYKKSTAVLRIARMLDGLWPLLFAFIIVPPALRDTVYDFIGKRRYRWFGKMDACWAPSEDFDDRFT